MKALLIVEDDAALGEGLRIALQAPETELCLCRSLSAARDALKSREFDLMLLDVNLPDGSGLDFVRKLRQEGKTGLPVILLTANDTELDIVAGLESGADDYVTKPFSLAILRARINTQLRRGTSAEGRVEMDGFSFDFDRMEFRRDGQPVDLSKTEQRLLRLLVENRGQTLSRGQLLDRVWPDGAEFVDENALSVTIRRLRATLEPDPSRPRYLKTVYGIGYSWNLPN